MLSKIPIFLASLFSSLMIISGQLSAAAEDPSLQQRIDAAAGVLQYLDQLANSCLESEISQTESSASPSASSEPRASSPCTAFIEAIDGEILAGYLQHCNALKTWRDDYVVTTVGANSASAQSEQNLRLMVGIEYNCGENALLKRSRFVAQAFELASQRKNLSQSLNSTALNRVREYELQNRLNEDQRSILRSVQQEHQRQRQRTQDQFRRLENELIRQQINQPRQ